MTIRGPLSQSRPEAAVAASRFLLVLLAGLSMAGCGWFERKVTANITGHAVTCVDGVAYLQFPSGVTVQYDRSGRIKTC